MTNAEKVLAYLRSIAPRAATNSRIRAETEIGRHATVYQETRLLMTRGTINGQRSGREWEFWFGPAVPPAKDTERLKAAASKPEVGRPPKSLMSPAAFEALAREVLSARFGKPLAEGRVGVVGKRFDMVSEDRSIVGDAKYYSLVGGKRLPPAKFSIIAEHVWLLEKTGAATRFLVFGNDRRVPLWWLEKYGNLVTGIDFYYLDDDGQIELLNR